MKFSGPDLLLSSNNPLSYHGIYILPKNLWSGFSYLYLNMDRSDLIETCGSVAKSCLTLWDPMDYSLPGSSAHHDLLEFAQIQVHWAGGVI